MALPAKLKHFNIFNDAHSYMGKCKELTLPKLVAQTEEWRAGGMDIPVEVFLGHEVMTLEWSVGGYEVQVFKQFGMQRIDGTILRFTGAIQNDDTGEVKAVEVVMRGRHKEIDVGSAEAGGDTEMNIVTTLSYYKLTIDGEDLIEIDNLNMILKVDGQDKLEAHRQALGI
jgi:P2 family phage contractile tail tube protein